MIPTAEQILGMMSPPQGAQNKFATVTRLVSSRPFVMIDGEDDESPTRYPIAYGLSVSAGQRVLLVPVGGTYVIVCRITP